MDNMLFKLHTCLLAETSIAILPKAQGIARDSWFREHHRPEKEVSPGKHPWTPSSSDWEETGVSTLLVIEKQREYKASSNYQL